ncbi:MAG: MBL fold metallo-hydrolase [Clostridiales bacterium]|nr:MBL fold metallo-hydrolase [Clostridiales bacterium]
MKICTLASSSSGNCALISHGKTHILIDAGISLRRITKSLKALGVAPGELAAVLVTHEHTDHISGIKMLVKYHAVPIFATEGAAAGILECVPEAEPLIRRIRAGAGFSVGEMDVLSFRTPHDTPESVGYRFYAGGRTLAFATDCGCLTKELVDGTRGADLAVIEANHDVEMLKNGRYPEFLKRRVLSSRGHLSNDDCGRLAVLLGQAGTRQVVLAHLSRENNTPQAAHDTVAAALRGAGAEAGDVQIGLAPPDDLGCVYIL